MTGITEAFLAFTSVWMDVHSQMTLILLPGHTPSTGMAYIRQLFVAHKLFIVSENVVQLLRFEKCGKAFAAFACVCLALFAPSSALVVDREHCTDISFSFIWFFESVCINGLTRKNILE